MFPPFLSWNYSIFCFCALVKWLNCQETNGSNASTMSSREQMQPMPLIMHLNQSTADILIQEANSIYVSNTSFGDLINDNDTYQLLMRYRERKRRVRLKTIQQEILLKLGFDQEPNVTSRITEQQRQSLISSFDRLQENSDINNNETDTE